LKFSFKKLLTALAVLLLPSALLCFVLRLLGHQVRRTAKIGFSVLWVEKLYLDEMSRIGHGNLISVDRLLLRRSASVGRSNLLHGPFDVVLAGKASIGNRNTVLRARRNVVTVGLAKFWLGQLSQITSDHRVDCTCTVRVGHYSTLAGAGSQVWTHGYLHDLQGPGRYRLDGSVRIGNNVYIGARAVLSMGVYISSGVIVGAGTTVARDLTEPGLYVSSALRQLPRPADPGSRADLERLRGEALCETVYRKRTSQRRP
jgi:acetyltransferase-like isoleucine patch superfamily enzyme